MTDDDKPLVVRHYGYGPDGSIARLIVSERSGDALKCSCPGVKRDGCPCDRCHGRGWFPEMIDGSDTDYNERYCDCADGERLRQRDR